LVLFKEFDLLKFEGYPLCRRKNGLQILNYNYFVIITKTEIIKGSLVTVIQSGFGSLSPIGLKNLEQNPEL